MYLYSLHLSYCYTFELLPTSWFALWKILYKIYPNIFFNLTQFWMTALNLLWFLRLIATKLMLSEKLWSLIVANVKCQFGRKNRSFLQMPGPLIYITPMNASFIFDPSDVTIVDFARNWQNLQSTSASRLG